MQSGYSIGGELNILVCRSKGGQPIYNTRSSSKSSYYIVQVRTNYGKLNLRYRGAVIRNSLNEYLKSKSLKSFKNEVKQ